MLHERFVKMSIQFMCFDCSPDGVVVRALSCGRSNTGSNPGPDRHHFAKQIFGRGSTRTDHKKTTGVSQTQEKVTEQKQYHLISKKTSMLLNKSYQNRCRKHSLQPESILGLFFRSRSLSGQDTLLWQK